MIRKSSDILPELEYFIKGDNPKLLIHCGTHGDEFESINIVKRCIEKYEDRLPDFVFVPVVSPSAVFAKTRVNSNGKDLNRIFYSDSEDLEVKANIKILNDYKFDLFVSFHEDPLTDEYYIYDSGYSLDESEVIKRHNKKLKKMGIELLNGIDDADDPDLGFEFVNGYKKFIEKKEELNNGMITVWSMLEKDVQTCLTPETPGLLGLSKKEAIIDSFFKDVLCLKQ